MLVGLLRHFGVASARSAGLGTVGLAYLVHKATSPLRFPPTVALTAAVARRLSREATPVAGADNG